MWVKRFKRICLYLLIQSMAYFVHVEGVPNFLQSPVALLIAIIIFYSGYIMFDSWEDG